MDPQVIHITGASGSGTSTLGRAIAARHGYKWLDSDAFIWQPTDPPYTQLRPRELRAALLAEALAQHPRCVISGSLCGWGDAFLPRFERIIWLQAPTQLRLERLRKRELEEIGPWILPGGDMHKNHVEFLDWAGRYDTGDESMRSYAAHERWLRGAACPVLVLDGTKPVEELVNAAMEHVGTQGNASPTKV